MEEVHTIVNIVRTYCGDAKQEEIRIITPYDAQRGAISDALKRADLPDSIVYNVDSFQGAPLSSLSPSRLCNRSH